MTARASLRERVAKARSQNHLDLRCTSPGLEGLYVRCRALSGEEMDDIPDGEGPVAMARQSLSLLSAACIAVWEEVDGVGVSPVDGFDGRIDLRTGQLTGTFPTFADPELGEALGVEEPTAYAAIRALLAPNSDLRLRPYGDKLAAWSAGMNEQLVRTVSGN